MNFKNNLEGFGVLTELHPDLAPWDWKYKASLGAQVVTVMVLDLTSLHLLDVKPESHYLANFTLPARAALTRSLGALCSFFCCDSVLESEHSAVRHFVLTAMR